MSAPILVPYGEEAERALRDAIVAAKGGHALAPVTVAVPSNYTGLSVRRRLGRGELRLGDASGYVNVRFIVLARVAELLGAPALAAQQRRPLTSAVRAEAIRAALADDPGVFREVADHTATERSLDATFRDLRRTPEDALPAIERQGPRAASVVRAYRHVRGLADRYYDEEDLIEAATAAVDAGSPALRDVGHVILYLPRRLSPAERGFVDALERAGGITVIIGQTGDEEADGPARRLVESLAGSTNGSMLGRLHADEIVAVTDAEEEVRFALRRITDLLAEGTPLHRIAVLYPTAQPYALLVHEQFEAAKVPHNGPAVRTLAQTMPGRTLLALLRLREVDFRRDTVLDWLSTAPVLEQARGRPAPAHRWDTISRDAGVLAGGEQWQRRLDRYIRTQTQRRESLERRDDTPESQLLGLNREIEFAQRLGGFMAELVENLKTGRDWSWSQHSAWARRLLDRYLGGEGHRKDWPDSELEAYNSVEAAVETLAGLDAVRPTTDEAVFRRALERELEGPASRIGRFGDGAFTGRIRDATGTSFDVAILLGMTEGLVPPRGRDDPLLPDTERAAAGDDVPLRTQRRAEERRDYLAALAVAARRVLVYPRADLRGQRGRLPARWLLESASALADKRMYSDDLDERPSPPWLTIVPSFEGALANGTQPASEQEYGLRSLVRWQRNGGSAIDHYLAAARSEYADGLDADFSRSGNRFTKWDGKLGDTSDLMPSAERAISPTALQNWASCPRKYLFGNVLYVAETVRPEETLRLTAIDRGNIIHNALERFFNEQLPIEPDHEWIPGQRNRLLAIGSELCGEAEAAGITGKAVLWQLDRARIMRDLAGFLDADEALRREFGVAPVHLELAFGVQDGSEPAVLMDLDGRREIAFRGRIDRVDRAPDGSHLLVLDYKTGKASPYTKLDKDPVKRGTLLQLPIYALAAQQAFAKVPTDAYYWFATDQESYGLAGYQISHQRHERFREALVTIVEGIRDGVFPARPGDENKMFKSYESCLFCPYTRVCPSDKARAWERKRGEPELAAYVTLAEGNPD